MKNYKLLLMEKSKVDVHCTWNFSERSEFFQNKDLEKKQDRHTKSLLNGKSHPDYKHMKMLTTATATKFIIREAGCLFFLHPSPTWPLKRIKGVCRRSTWLVQLGRFLLRSGSQDCGIEALEPSSVGSLLPDSFSPSAPPLLTHSL